MIKSEEIDCLKVTLEELKEQRKRLDALILMIRAQVEILENTDDNVFDRYMPPVA